jgi:hypothetical protein
MLSEKQFRERAKTELRQIGEQLLGLSIDRDIYAKFERDIVQNNRELQSARSEFIDMLRGCYADAMAARVLRLLDGDGGPSLPGVLTGLAQHEQIMDDKITEREFTQDRTALQQAFVNLQRAMVPHTAHHERTLPALASLHRELDAALDLMIESAKTYYWIVSDSYMQLDVKYSGDPLSVFQFAWAMPVLTR